MATPLLDLLRVKKLNRYSCRCRLCKAKWTTEKGFEAAYREHQDKCQRSTEVIAARRERFKSSDDSERYQVAAQYFSYRQITGRFNADVKCDGRCMGATGHNCECSCGGANHGIGAAA